MAEDLLKKYTFAVDSIKASANGKPMTIAFSQGDVKTAILIINLTENDTALDLTGKKVRVSFKKSDGTSVMQDMTTGISFLDAAAGKIQIQLSTQALSARGNVRGQISISDEVAGLVAETAEFTFVVRESIVNTSIISRDELPIIEQTIEAAKVLESVDLNTIVNNTGNVNSLKSEVETARGASANLAGRFSSVESSLAQKATKEEDSFVNVKSPKPPLVGAKGDGVTDDYQAITNLFSYCDTNGLGLLIPSSVYMTSQPLMFNGKFPIVGVRGYSIFKAKNTMENVLVIDKDNNNLIRNNSFRHGVLEGISIDANNFANTALYIRRGKGITINGVYTTNPLVQSCLIGGEVDLKIWELIIKDSTFVATNNTGTAQYSMYIKGGVTDSWFENILWINGSVNFLRIDGISASSIKSSHGYAYPETLAPDTGMKIITSGTFELNEISVDTVKRVGLDISGVGGLVNNLFTAMKTGYIDTGTGDICSVKVTGDQFLLDNITLSGMTDSDKQSRTSIVIFDNTANKYDFRCGSLRGHVGSLVDKDLKLIGKIPVRFTFKGGTQVTNYFKFGNDIFKNQYVYSGNASKSFTFANERLSNQYVVNVELPWSSNWFITNKTTAGFTVNFGTPPTATYTIDVFIYIPY
jgi:hypothetical protein